MTIVVTANTMLASYVLHASLTHTYLPNSWTKTISRNHVLKTIWHCETKILPSLKFHQLGIRTIILGL